MNDRLEVLIREQAVAQARFNDFFKGERTAEAEAEMTRLAAEIYETREQIALILGREGY